MTTMSARPLLAAIAGVLIGSAAWALPAQYSVSQLYHTQWTAHDGAPTGIVDIAQTRDGFLWLGGPGGLFRFDGVEFERISAINGVPLLSQDIYSLRTTADGGLWIGHHLGGISHLKDGRLVNYGRVQGLPASSVYAFAQTAEGTMWAGTTRGVYRLEQGRWHAPSAAWNLSSAPVDSLVVDRDRTLWMLANGKISYLRHGASRFEQLPVTVGWSGFNSMLLDPGGAAMLCGGDRLRALTVRAPPSASTLTPDWQDRRVVINGDPPECLFDREGHLWIGDANGAGRFPPSPQAADPATTSLPFGKAERVQLTGDYVFTLFEDREGNIWFATRGGLDRFRAPALLKVTLDLGSNEFPLAAAGNHGVWIGTSTGHLFRSRQGTQEQIRFGGLAKRAGIDALHASPAGDLWLAGGDSIWQRQPDGSWRRSPRQGASKAPAAYAYSNIQTMTRDAQGAMWVSVLRVGMYRVVGDEWTLWGGRTDMPTQNANASFTDASGRVWLGYDDGAVAMLDGDRLAMVATGQPAPPQLPLGSVNAFAQQGELIWVGSEKGLWCLDGKLLQPVTGTRGAFIGVSGIVPGPAGDLWLGTVEGVVHIAADEVRQALAHPGHAVRHRLLNYLDGLPGVPEGAVGDEGRIWFSTGNGVVWTDPARTPRNTIAPSVIVKSMVANGVAHAIETDAPIQLPVHIRDLKISYTAPSLTMPERVMFRYRLGDEHAEWQDVGTRREAYFRDLPPGHYRFQVIASNNDGVWNDTGASIAFVIPPTFVQTGWFIALCAIAAVAVLWLLFLLRMRSVKARWRLRLEERMVERERIARELHDTFLQGVQGLVLRFHVAMEQIPQHEHARALMKDALDRADEVISEGRDAVTDLRATTGSSLDLAHELQVVGERWSRDLGLSFAMSIEGPRRELDPVALQECQRIAAEALGNAFRHSQGSSVRLSIACTPRQLVLRVADDGRGFETTQSHAGRWGLVGMLERANRMNGRLLVSSDGQGTTITLEVPARVAYAKRKRGQT